MEKGGPSMGLQLESLTKSSSSPGLVISFLHLAPPRAPWHRAAVGTPCRGYSLAPPSGTGSNSTRKRGIAWLSE